MNPHKLVKTLSACLVSALLLYSAISQPIAPAAQADSPGHALQFNGSSQYVTFGAAPGLNSTSFTLEAWIYKTDKGVDAYTGVGGFYAAPLITKGRADGENNNRDFNYFLGINPSGCLAADFESPGGMNHPIPGNREISLNTWTHVAATYDGKIWSLYVNGELDNSLEYATTTYPLSTSIEHAAIATALDYQGSPSGYFAGAMDEVRIWNYARTAADISGSMNQELPSAAGLIGRWSLNEGTGTTTADSGTSLSNGTLVGAPLWVAGAPALPSSADTNTPPVAISDAYSVIADTPLVIPESQGLLINDSDQDGDPLTAILSTGPAHGSLDLKADGSFTYNPATSYIGTDAFSYQASDGYSFSEPVTVNLTITSSIHPPDLPSSFYGTIQIPNNPPSPGSLLSVQIEGSDSHFSTPIVQQPDLFLTYEIDLPGDDLTTPEKDGGEDGDELIFSIADQIVAESFWTSGAYTQLDIHPPQALPGGPYIVNEAAPLVFSGSVNDAGGDNLSFQWDWENDGTPDSSGGSVSHLWEDSGSYQARLIATDSQGGVGETTFTITVNNLPPTATFVVPAFLNPSASFQILLTDQFDPSPIDADVGFTYAFDCGSGYGPFLTDPQTICQAPAFGKLTIKAMIRDQENDITEYIADAWVYATHKLTLQPGWNLVSVNLHPVDTRTGQVLQSINGSYDQVFAWDAAGQAWLQYTPSLASSSTLSSLDETKGFWLHVTSATPVQLEVLGIPLSATTISLQRGWNLVGYPASTAQPLPTALSDRGLSTQISRVYTYTPTSQADPWKLWDATAPAWASDLISLTPGAGYWFYAAEPAVWSFNTP